jgi:hypothetical protein
MERYLSNTLKIAQAEASFKALQKNEKPEVSDPYEAELTATREKTGRLRALRLAKEAAQALGPVITKAVR